MTGRAGFEPAPADVEELASAAVEAAFRVHRALGPGLLETVYQACMCHELGKMGVAFENGVGLPVLYDGVRLDVGFRVDLWLDKKVVVELKAVDAIAPRHKAQLLTYMKLSNSRLGLLLNFNAAKLKDGITRMIL